mgnify:CR=1 FL=1
MVIYAVSIAIAHFLKLSQIIDHKATKEGVSILQSRLIDDHSCTLCLDALHDPLNGTLAEVIAVALHRQAVYPDGHRLFLCGIIVALLTVIIVPGHAQHTVRNKILAGAVAFHDCTDQIFRYIGIICEQLFSVLGQAVPAVAEAGIVVMSTDTRIKADTCLLYTSPSPRD